MSSALHKLNNRGDNPNRKSELAFSVTVEAGKVNNVHKICPRCGTEYDSVAGFCPRDGTALTNAEEQRDPYIGRVLLDQFRIEEPIGAGGMGTVYRARQTTIDRDVAIKILHRELVQNPDAVRRFQREAKVSTQLDHPNIVRVFLFGQLADGNLYLVMEYLRGRSLLDVLRTEGPLEPSRALHIISQIAEGVGEAHQHGVVHRDVKPENVVLIEKGRDADFVKVLDFGVARFLWGEQTVATQSGLIFGTARYISPEGAAGEETDARSDVYSIGVVAYQLLSGETPFESPSPVAMLMKHINEPPPDLASRLHGSRIPRSIADVVMRALAKNPAARFGDGREFAEALREAARNSGVSIHGMSRESFAAAYPAISPRFGASIAPARSSSVPMEPGRAERMSEPATASGAIPHAVRTNVTPTNVTPTPPAQQSYTLAAAPNPFQDEGADLESNPKSNRFRFASVLVTMLLAFALGAAAVIAGVMLLKGSSEDQSSTIASLEARARQALDHGALDSPPEENVADLTSRILAQDPGSPRALDLRARAANKLLEQARTARSQGYVQEARSLCERSLRLVPENSVAREEMARLENAVDAGLPHLGADPLAQRERESRANSRDEGTRRTKRNRSSPVATPAPDPRLPPIVTVPQEEPFPREENFPRDEPPPSEGNGIDWSIPETERATTSEPPTEIPPPPAPWTNVL